MRGLLRRDIKRAAKQLGVDLGAVLGKSGGEYEESLKALELGDLSVYPPAEQLKRARDHFVDVVAEVETGGASRAKVDEAKDVRGGDEIRALDNPFYRALNELLAKSGFDEFAEEACREFYADNRGRPGIAPGVYFRMMMVGYLEGIGSERGIAWRCGDSLSLREFLGYGWAKNPPEHSTLSKTRKRLSVEAHAAVFGRVLELLKGSGLLSGKTLGVDSTTLEANAAMRTIVRRDDGLGYDEWLEQVARASGIETPTRKDLTTLDRKRPKKGSWRRAERITQAVRAT